MMSIFSPAPHIERLPEGQIDSTYKRLRKEVFAGTFIGYATSAKTLVWLFRT